MPNRQAVLAVLVAMSWLLNGGTTRADTDPMQACDTLATVTLRALPEIAAVQCGSRFFGYQAAVDRDTTDGETAYDYCPFLMWDRQVGLYRLYTGGRWLRKGIPWADGDHILHFVSPSGGAGTWFMPRNRPEVWNPAEEGQPDTWYSGNCLEPEVVKVQGTYYMYAQVQGNPKADMSDPQVTEAAGVDRIVLFTSDDGFCWRRASAARGVVVGFDAPAATVLHHQEVIYVPWDAEGKPFWLYVAAGVEGKSLGYVRMRSDDPTTYDWRKREPAGLAQLGNQIGYAKQAPGGPLLVRITFTGGKDGKTAPTLQFSRDGLAWFFGDDGPALLAGSDDDDKNRNCYFLALSTLDGTGELEYVGDNTYRALYAATTCSTPVAPEIFHSEIGLGELVLHIEPREVGGAPQ